MCTESHHNYSQFLKYNRAYIFLQLTRMICCYIFVTLLTTQCLQTLHSLKYTTHLIICNSPYTHYNYINNIMYMYAHCMYIDVLMCFCSIYNQNDLTYKLMA